MGKTCRYKITFARGLLINPLSYSRDAQGNKQNYNPFLVVFKCYIAFLNHLLKKGRKKKMNKGITEREEEHLEKLPVYELIDHLMRLPAKKRMEAILERTDAEAVVGAMAEQDFYFTVKEVSPDDALPLLALAHVAQLNHLFDLEWWQKDQILPARAAEWLERLAQTGERRFLIWLYQADFELLVTLFKKWLHVAVITEDMDPLEAIAQMPTQTLDNQYFWEARYPQYQDLFRNILGYLFEAHKDFYKALMNHIVYTSETEVKELAYRFHRGRLEDRAIPDFYDALEIYHSIGPENIPHNKEVADLETAPSFALATVPQSDLLGQTIQKIQDVSLFQTLQLELAILSNKVIVVDGLSLDDPENLHRGANKAAAYVNLGLHLKCAGNLEMAVRILQEVFLEHLFRLAQAKVARLRNALQKVIQQGWLAQWPEGLDLLEPQWQEIAELLLDKTPRLFRTHSQSDRPPVRDFFRTPKDLHQGSQYINAIVAMGPLFESLHVNPEKLLYDLWQEGQIRGLKDVTLGTIIWTAAARFQLEGKWEFNPLPFPLWSDLFPRLQPSTMEASIRSWVNERAQRAMSTNPDVSWPSFVDIYLNPLFQEYIEEMMPFSPHDPPNPRLVRFFLFKRE
jgi:tetratricopeptide (TPR) repeat protein